MHIIVVCTDFPPYLFDYILYNTTIFKKKTNTFFHNYGSDPSVSYTVWVSYRTHTDYSVCKSDFVYLTCRKDPVEKKVNPETRKMKLGQFFNSIEIRGLIK